MSHSIPGSLLFAALLLSSLAVDAKAEPATSPAGADIFSYNQNSVFHQEDGDRIIDELTAYTYCLNSGSRDNFIKFFVPMTESGKSTGDDEFSTAAGPANPHAGKNAAYFDSAKRYYDAGSPFLASITVHLDRYNAENQTFITDCVRPTGVINLGDSFSRYNGTLPKDCGERRLVGYLVGGMELFRYLKVPVQLAEKLATATWNRSVTIEYIVRKGNPPIKDFLASNKDFFRDPKDGLILSKNSVLIPASIVAYRITGSPEVDALAVQVKPCSYERTKTEVDFGARVNRKIFVAGSNDQYVFFAEGAVIAKNAAGLFVGEWYLIKNKIFIRPNGESKLLVNPFEFSPEGDLVIDSVIYRDKGPFQGTTPHIQSGARKAPAEATAPADLAAAPAVPLNPLTSILDAFKIAADTKQPVKGISGKDACFLEITSVEGETFEGVYHDVTSGEPFIYTVKGKVSKDAASFTAAEWVQRPASLPESDPAPGSGCSAEFKLGLNGVCSGRIRYKTWERSALTINLVAEKSNAGNTAGSRQEAGQPQEVVQRKEVVQPQEDPPPVQVFVVVNKQVNTAVTGQPVAVTERPARAPASPPVAPPSKPKPSGKDAQKTLFDEALRQETEGNLSVAIEKYKEAILMDSSTPIALKAMERMDASQKKLTIEDEKARREANAVVNGLWP